MLSLPLLPPQDSPATWLRSRARARSPSPPPLLHSAEPNQQQTHRQRQQRDEEKKQFNARSALAQLAADEAAIAARKAAVRNFGAYWIRPPGVPKTLQAMTEEEAERLEQAELERQERGLLDMQAQQQLEEARQRADEATATAAGGEQTEEAEEERDLDDDIPDAEDANTTTEVTFNEDSVMEGSQFGREHNGDGDNDDDDEHQALVDAEQYAELEEAELTGAARDEEALGIELERDLDDSIPEAGSYQHTDTELEDTSDSELNSSFAATGTAAAAAGQASRSSGRAAPQMRPMFDLQPMSGLQERMRAQVGAADALTRSPGSLNLSSSVMESSFAGSSPVVQRSNHARQGRGPQTRRARHS